MLRRISILFIGFGIALMFTIKAHRPVILDKATRKPLSSASIFNNRGHFIGTSGKNGEIYCAKPADYPLSIRYMGYEEVTYVSPETDTIYLVEKYTQLPEIVVESRDHKMLHTRAYVREYSTLACFTDTVTLYREKMVDFMIPGSDRSRYRGWHLPRVMNSRSYYRFSNMAGLDSVSDRCNQNFSWSDWVGMPPVIQLPDNLKTTEYGTDTLQGKYSAYELWSKAADRITVDINVMADTIGRRWVPALRVFFKRENNEFERFGIRVIYDNNSGINLDPKNLTGYACDIESRGRGHGMFMFNRHDQPFFVSTHTEVYILDREYVTVKQAKKIERLKFSKDEVEFVEPIDAPQLDLATATLIHRVNNIDQETVRTHLPADRRYVNPYPSKKRDGLGYRALDLLKNLFGISKYKMNKHNRETWNNFKKEQIRQNNSHFYLED